MKCVYDGFMTDDLKGMFTKQYVMMCDGFMTDDFSM